MSTRRTRANLAALVLALAATLGGCSAGVYADTVVPSTPSDTQQPAAPAASDPVVCDNPLASYAPQGPASPATIPDGSTMDAIRERGRLIVGVSGDTLLLGARDPISGQIDGFDIEMARVVAKAIFGDDNHLELKVITAAQRIEFLQDGTVDMVARNMTITCERWEQIGFSAQYYQSGQKILVSLGSTATSIDDLAGARVCAPSGTSSLANLADHPDVVAVPASTHTDCLVKFQQGQVDAITGDDTVLAGLAAQDPYAKVIGEAFTSEPYGLGFKSEAVDLIRFANAALEQAKTDGTWVAAYDRWLAPALGAVPTAPVAVYSS